MKKGLAVQPDYAGVRISPDGEHIAYIAPANGVRNLFVAPAADPRAGRYQLVGGDFAGSSLKVETGGELVRQAVCVF